MEIVVLIALLEELIVRSISKLSLTAPFWFDPSFLMQQYIFLTILNVLTAYESWCQMQVGLVRLAKILVKTICSTIWSSSRVCSFYIQ